LHFRFQQSRQPKVEVRRPQALHRNPAARHTMRDTPVTTTGKSITGSTTTLLRTLPLPKDELLQLDSGDEPKKKRASAMSRPFILF